MSDRRRQQRIGYSGKAYVTYGGKCHSDKILDISEYGARISTRSRVRPGRAVRLYIPLPSEQGWRLCFIDGTVVRRDRKFLDGGEYGVRFEGGRSPAKQLLKAFVHDKSA